MSVFSDFQEAWCERFPGHSLPKDWEADVRSNLTKHRQRVSQLKDELEKEQFYVDYFESLLAGVEQVKSCDKNARNGVNNSESEKSSKNGTDSEQRTASDQYVTIINVSSYGEIQKPLSKTQESQNKKAVKPDGHLKKLIENPLYQDARSLSLELASQSGGLESKTRGKMSSTNSPPTNPPLQSRPVERARCQSGSKDIILKDPSKTEVTNVHSSRRSSDGPTSVESVSKNKVDVTSPPLAKSQSASAVIQSNPPIGALESSRTAIKPLPNSRSLRDPTRGSQIKAIMANVKAECNRQDSTTKTSPDDDARRKRPPTPPRKPKIDQLVKHFQQLESSTGVKASSTNNGPDASPLIGKKSQRTKVNIGASSDIENHPTRPTVLSKEENRRLIRNNKSPETPSTPHSMASLASTPDSEEILKYDAENDTLIANDQPRSNDVSQVDDTSTSVTLAVDGTRKELDQDMDDHEDLDDETAHDFEIINNPNQETNDALDPGRDRRIENLDDDDIYDTVAPDEDVLQSSLTSHSHDSCERKRVPIVGTPCSTIDDSDLLNEYEKQSSSVRHQQLANQQSYSNYVNIDYFLKRDETSSRDDSDDNETQLSRSFSSMDHDLDDPSSNTSSHNLVRGASTHSNSSRKGVVPTRTGSASGPPPFIPQPKLRRSRDQLKDSSNDLVTSKSPGSTISKSSISRGQTSAHQTYDEVFEPVLATYDSVPDLTDTPMVEVDVTARRSEREKPIFQTEEERRAEESRITMYKCISASIIESETVYVDCLNTLISYLKALKATIGTTNALLTVEDLAIISFKISDLYQIHCLFLEGVKKVYECYDKSSGDRCGASTADLSGDGIVPLSDLFKVLASKLSAYSAYIKNYSKAIDTVHRCAAQNSQFSEVTKKIKLQSLNGQTVSLEELLHKPVARVQKNSMVLNDLIRYTPENHPEFKSLRTALKMTQSFLNDLNMAASMESIFPVTDKSQRRLVKESFIVFLADGRRKLRHLFLFNDALVCAKYKPSTKQKFTFDLKWYLMLSEISIPTMESIDVSKGKQEKDHSAEVLSLKSKLGNIRDLIRKELKGMSDKTKTTSRVLDKLRKRQAEYEAQLVLLLPSLVLPVTQTKSKTIYTFYLSSDYERVAWIESIHNLQQIHSSAQPCDPINLTELQAWFESCRKSLKPNLGSWCLRSNTDEELLCGDLFLRVDRLRDLSRPADIFFAVELDSYGHYLPRGNTKVSRGTAEPFFDQEFALDLDGSKNIRIICYEEIPAGGSGSSTKPVMRGRTCLELSRSWLSETWIDKNLPILDSTLSVSMRFVSIDCTASRFPASKLFGSFGVGIQQVCKKEKSSVPYLIQCCVREVERRGMKEVGIYRVSGLSSDIQKLKKSFESNPFETEHLIKEIDIHAVTGLLKLYLRELPEALCTSNLYKKFFEAFSMNDQDEKKAKLIALFNQLPAISKNVIVYLIDHMLKINELESHNKMSLHNIATVFGPTMIRPAGSGSSDKMNSNTDLFTSGTIDVMAQAGILHFFLMRKYSGQSLTSLEDNGDEELLQVRI